MYDFLLTWNWEENFCNTRIESIEKIPMAPKPWKVKEENKSLQQLESTTKENTRMKYYNKAKKL